MNRLSRIGSLLPVLALAACGFGNGDADSKATSLSVRALVKTQPATVGTVERTLELTATLQAGRAVDLVTDFPGKIKELPVKIGDEVKAGALLARLDTEAARLQYDQAQAASGLATLGMGTAEREFGRAEALHASKSLTDQQYEQARAGLDMARLQKAQADAMAGLADKQVRGGVLTAPFSSVVSAVCCEVGEYFNPMTISPMGGPQGLVSLVDLSTVKADLQVSDRDIARIEKGMAAHILVDVQADLLPPGGLPAAVETVGLAADPAARTFPVRVVADNPERVLRAGTHARVRLVLESRAGVVSVPPGAVVRLDEQVFVVTVVEGKAHRVPVTLGIEGNEAVEIASGLQGGEQVVVEGNFGLPDGAVVDVNE
jgi:RND family efflux transporter MFP subunit